MSDRKITEQNITINNCAVCVHTGPAPGSDSATLLLIHGGWGSADMHWSPIWETLSENVRVIAPELPGMGYGSTPITSTVLNFSQWLERLMDHLEIDQFWAAGNSLGGAIAWQLALNVPDRVKGLILINGGPLPPLSKIVQGFARTPFGRLCVRAIAKRVAFSQKAVEAAFADFSRVPEPLINLCQRRRSPQLSATTDVIIDGALSKTTPDQPGLIIWGTEDRLHGSRPAQAKRLQHRLNDARLVEIPDAGHMPQIERPRLVIDALAGFVGF